MAGLDPAIQVNVLRFWLAASMAAITKNNGPQRK
jgi:hypothetical protein